MMTNDRDGYAVSLWLEGLLGVPPVLPLNGKTPTREKWSMQPRLDPSAWREQLHGYFGNLGILTGALRGGGYLVIVDADARVPEWEDSLDRLYALGMPRHTITVLTGGGGRHLYYWSPVPITKGPLHDFPGIDLQAEGAQAVIPYSVHPDTGNVYEWEFNFGPEDVPLAVLPEALIRLFGEHHRTEQHARTGLDERTVTAANFIIEHFGATWWKEAHGIIELTRPGKERGSSGTVGALEEPDAFFVHSSAWPPFERGHAYSMRELRKLAGEPSLGAQLAAGIKVGAEEWELPVSLEDAGPLPSFALHVMPEWLTEYVAQLSHAKQTPPDLAASLSLACLAASSGGRVLVSPTSGWAEFTNLFLAVAMRSGEGKSPVFTAMTKPLREWEREQKSASVPLVLEATNARNDARARAKDAKRKATKEANAEKRARFLAEADALDLEAELMVIPVPPRLLCRDVTPEALEELLFYNRGSIALMSPEGGVFDNFAGRYSKGPPNVDVFLSGHDGEELRVDRIGRGSFSVPCAVLTIGATFQPAVLRRAAHVAVNIERGVLARWLLVKPVSMRGYRDKKGAKPVNVNVEHEYFERMYRIVDELAQYSDPMVLTFTNEARAALADYDQALEVRMRPGGDLESVAEFASKLAGTVARIAALLHIAHEEDPVRWRLMVELVNVERAIELGDYFLAHTIGVMRYARANPVIEDADRILRWAINRAEHSARTFTRREAQQGLSGFEKVEQLDAPLRELVEHGWLRVAAQRRSGSKGGRPPGPSFELHPQAAHFYREHHLRTDDTDATS